MATHAIIGSVVAPLPFGGLIVDQFQVHRLGGLDSDEAFEGVVEVVRNFGLERISVGSGCLEVSQQVVFAQVVRTDGCGFPEGGFNFEINPVLIASCVEGFRQVEGWQGWMPCCVDSVGDDFRFGWGSEMAAQADFGGDGWICEIEEALL